MLDIIKALIRQNDHCVLATVGDQGPHTSLMAYIASADASEIFLVTPKDTLKYENMRRDHRVSLMVDSRDKGIRGEIRALTIAGHADELIEPEAIDSVRAGMLDRHPHLMRLLDAGNVAWIRVQVDRFQLLDGVHDAYHLRPSSRTGA